MNEHQITMLLYHLESIARAVEKCVDQLEIANSYQATCEAVDFEMPELQLEVK